MNYQGIILAAHRGDRKTCPENTMPAFEAALNAGMDMIETDIHMTRDGELVLIHDRNLKRTAGVDALVDQLSLEEVRKADAGALFAPEFAGTKIPTVREFLELIRDTSMTVNWELKDYPHEVGDEHAFAAADRLWELLCEYDMLDRGVINSFSDRVLEHWVKQHGHRMPIHGQGIYRCQKTCDHADIPQEELYDWCCLYPSDGKGTAMTSPENFEYCKERNIGICLLFPDTEENYRSALALGGVMLTTNDIYEADRILRLLGVRK